MHDRGANIYKYSIYKNHMPHNLEYREKLINHDWEISPKDKNGNVIDSKQSVLINAQNNYFYSSKKLIAAVDVEDLVVVEMNDAILVCKRENSQNVKMIVDHLERKDLEEYL